MKVQEGGKGKVLSPTGRQMERETDSEAIQRLREREKVFLSVCQGGYSPHTNHMTTECSWEL